MGEGLLQRRAQGKRKPGYAYGRRTALVLGLILCGLPAVAARSEAIPTAVAPAASPLATHPLATPDAAPNLKTDTAVYHLEKGTLQYAFTFVNPSDSVVFLDCQIPPHARLSGSTLVLTFDRKPAQAGGGGHGVSSEGTGRVTPQGDVIAGGPIDGSAVNPDDFPPQRVAGHQTFLGQRRLDRVLGDPVARPAFARLQLVMAWYPERTAGEGAPFDTERGGRVTAPAKASSRKGKAPPPPKVQKTHVRTDAVPEKMPKKP